MNELVIIKLGGSVLTNKNIPFSLRKKDFDRLISEIALSTKSKKGLIVSHGGGSFAHADAVKYSINSRNDSNKSIQGLSSVAYGVSQLNYLVTTGLIKNGVNVIKFSPSSFIFSKNDVVKDILTKHVLKALSLNLIPIVHGDIVFDDEKNFTIFSTEKVIASLLPAIKEANKYKNIRMYLAQQIGPKFGA